MKNKLLALGAAALLMLTSCLKDKDVEDRKHGMAGIEDIDLIGFIGSPQATVGVFSSDNDTTVTLLTVRLHAESVAKEDIHIKLVRDDEQVIDAGLEVLPSDRFTMPSLDIVIPKGQQEANIPITFAPNDLLDGHYGLAFHIDTVNTKGYVLRAMFRDILVEIGVRNEFDGTYRATGDIVHPTVGGPYEQVIDLETYNENSVIFYQPNRNGLFNVEVIATVNNDNTVTITPVPGYPVVYVPAGGVNTYDPVTRTFTLRFNWPGSPAHREAVNTFVYMGPRP